ncbi:unnamed protein product [Dibothriocephalus latus]|uniref:Uncharacterized protein n=1 Tax=Dibothriocephalus latus TaxID=60516 RepID=A0A3P7N555_DIBLA|nr:unnamed protein product [Dibothriocephalus latus]
MIIPAVFGSVAAIFASILQYQNGGLLNVFIKPVPPTNGQSEVSFEPQQDPSVISTHVTNIVWGKLSESDLAVLAALPENVGGGDKAVAEAIANPNLEGQIIITFIVCLVLASLGLLAIFIFSFIYCCCCSSGCHGEDDDDEKVS